MVVSVKICGLKTAETVDAAVGGGAAFIGFNFYPPSPRSLSATDAAALITRVPDGIGCVGLFVDPDDALLESVLGQAALTMIQLHGKEPPDRVAQIRARFGRPVMKAVSVAEEEDFAAVAPYAAVSDWLLFDAKPPKRPESLPGGNAVSFDWTLLRDRAVPVPWMLAGGLEPGNVAEAIRITGAQAVDVSSGVESAKGVKDPARIAAFLKAAHQAAITAEA